MKTWITLFCLVATFFAASSHACSVAVTSSSRGERVTPRDSILYNNGPNDNMGAYLIWRTDYVTDSFVLTASSSTLNSVTFSNWFQRAPSTAYTVDWAITTEPFGGNTLASGTGALSGYFVGIQGMNYIYSETFSLGGVNLGAGTYYLQLGNEIADLPGFWGESNGPSAACQEGTTPPPPAGDGGCTPIPSETFYIAGTSNAPVPEPDTLLLLAPGLLASAGAMRRKLAHRTIAL